MASFTDNSASAIEMAVKAREKYLEATKPNLPTGLKLMGLKKAYQMFVEARKLSPSSAEEWLKLTKNIAVIADKIACDKGSQSRYRYEEVARYFKESARAYQEALVNAKLVMDKAWILSIVEKLRTLVNNFAAYLIDSVNRNWQLRVGRLQQFAEQVREQPEASVALQMAICNELRKACIIYFEEENDWLSASSILEDMHRPLTELMMHLKHIDSLSDAESQFCDFMEDYQGLKRRVVSTRYRELAAQRQNKLLDAEGDWSADILDEVLDMLRLAIRAAKGEDDSVEEDEDDVETNKRRAFDLECEAIACSFLGLLYVKLKLGTDSAQRLLFQAIVLADAIKDCDGRTFFNQKWWQDAKKELEAIRKRRACYDEEKMKKKRQPTLKKIKPELDAIDAAEQKHEDSNERMKGLVEHLLKKHPPKMRLSTIRAKLKKVKESNETEDFKRLMVLCAAAYHPDKNKDHGVEWLVLCEEVVKKINGYTDGLKGF